ncbi:MAG TPA: hypothetical protein VHB20_07470 [Verrucomicrobiae bacterium]|jgi:hypothetical protein|nr:hypothetical protein [Verrucomicrobiae bacterium]
MQFVTPQPWDDLVAKLGSQSIVGSTLNSFEWSNIPVGLRENAFFSSTVEDVRFLQSLRDALNDFLANNKETLPDGSVALAMGSRAQFVRDMNELAVSRGLGPLDPDDAGTLKDITSQSRLSLIFNTKTQQMYSYGYWKQGMDPDLLDEFPAQRFIRVQDVNKPRLVHQNNEGVVKLKTDLTFWLSMNDPSFGGFGVPWGPWGFNSGMGEEDVDREESERMGLIKPGEKPDPIVKDVNDHLQASVEGLDDDMIAHLKNTFGDQIDVQGGAAVWTNTAPADEPEAPPAPVAPPADNTESLPAILDRLGLTNNDAVTADDMRALVNELKESEPASVDDAVTSITGTLRKGSLTKAAIKQHAQDFLAFVPPAVVKDLPDLKIEVRPLFGANGIYHRGTISLNDSLNDLPPDEARRVIFHEMEHWLHIDGPSDAFRKAIKDHFTARTAGEAVVSLPLYGSPGKLDKWYESYAGKIYDFEFKSPGGLEIPTRYVETLTKDPAALARLWNSDPYFRETLTIVLQGFFK